MQGNNYNRAMQFLAFDALKGFKEALLVKEKEIEDKKILSEDNNQMLNKKISKLGGGKYARIKYYYLLEYIEVFGIIKKIDNIYKKIYLSNTVIDFDDVIDIEIL